MNDSRTDLRLDVVADDRQPRSLEPRFPFRIAGDEDRHAVHDRHACLERAFHVEFGGLLRTDGQEVDQDIGPGLQRRHYLFLAGVIAIGHDETAITSFGHVRGNAVQHATAHDGHARCRNVGLEDGRVVGRGEDRLGQVLADLARIDIDAQHELDIARAIAADRLVDQSCEEFVVL